MSEASVFRFTTTAEFEAEYRRLMSSDAAAADPLIREGLEILLEGADEVEEDAAPDIEDHLVRTRAMYAAMLAEATELQRRLANAQRLLEVETARAPSLERRFRALQRRD